MSKLPRLNANRMAKVLELAGFTCTRSRGSHFAYRHPDGRATAVPFHGSKLLSVGLTTQILGQAEISEEQYRSLVAQL
jgi:predicted RNA binding protein YcfA (HicA-like mRNA interferase family)